MVILLILALQAFVDLFDIIDNVKHHYHHHVEKSFVKSHNSTQFGKSDNSRVGFTDQLQHSLLNTLL